MVVAHRCSLTSFLGFYTTWLAFLSVIATVAFALSFCLSFFSLSSFSLPFFLSYCTNTLPQRRFVLDAHDIFDSPTLPWYTLAVIVWGFSCRASQFIDLDLA